MSQKLTGGSILGQTEDYFKNPRGWRQEASETKLIPQPFTQATTSLSLLNSRAAAGHVPHRMYHVTELYSTPQRQCITSETANGPRRLATNAIQVKTTPHPPLPNTVASVRYQYCETLVLFLIPSIRDVRCITRCVPTCRAHFLSLHESPKSPAFAPAIAGSRRAILLKIKRNGPGRL